MYKYLFEKLEQTQSTYIDQLTFITAEIVNPGKSEAIEEFECLPFEEICKTLKWRNTPNTRDSIKYALEDKDNGLASFMWQNQRTGFLAVIHIPTCDNFRWNKGSSEPVSHQVYVGSCFIKYVYADTIHELIGKIVTESQLQLEKDIEAYKNKLTKEAMTELETLWNLPVQSKKNN